MQEAAFIKRNKPRWEEFEKSLKGPGPVNPDRLAELFLQVTDDLAFAQTQYPESRVTRYLNSLASNVHRAIYKNKKEERNRFINFWKKEVPEAAWQSRKELGYALVVFLISTAVGVLSATRDATFARLILGDDYITLTMENIKAGNPTKIYSSGSELNMFAMIMLNNILVSFRVFACGVFLSLGAGLMLFYNGVMMGSFMAFFYRENQLTHVLPVIMLHGTIELSSIVIAGGAGFVLGNSLLFPGTYSRLDSFKTGAKRGLKLVIGLVPFFVIAAFIESFVTQYAFMHWSLKMLVIGVSALLMVLYFVIYPNQLKRHGRI